MFARPLVPSTLAALTVFAITLTPAGAGPAPPPQEESSETAEPASYADSIVVTASRVEEKVQDAPVSMSLVTEKQIEAAPGKSYADLLRGLPGMNAIQVTAQQQEFATRSAVKTGNGSQLVLMNGRSIYVDFLGFIEWDSLPVSMDEVERIEVLNGPGSAVWGANSLAGVVNVITRAPASMEGGLFTIGAGEQGTLYGGLRWAAQTGIWAWKASASHYQQDPWERATYPSLPSYENQGTSQPKLDLRFDRDDGSSIWSFRAGYGGMSGMNLNAAGPWFVKKGSYFVYDETRFTRGTLDANLFVNRISMEAPNQFSDLVNELDATSIVGELTDRRAFAGRHVVTYGTTLRYSDATLAVAPRAGVREEGGAFLQDDFLLSQKLTVTAGARADWFDTIGTVFSPRLSAIWKPAQGQSLRASYGRGYRAPSEVERYAEIDQKAVLPLPTGPFVVTTHLSGNDQLEEETSDALELSWMADVGSRAFVSAAVYRNKSQGLVQLYPVSFYGPFDPPPGWPLPAEYAPMIPKLLSQHNDATVVNRGVELSARFRLPRGAEATAAWTRQNRPDVLKADPQSAVLFARPPRNQGSLLLSFVRPRWFGSAGATYTGEAFWSDVLDSRFWGPTDSYTMLNATAGWRIRATGSPVTLVVRGTNLGDKAIRQHYFGDIIRRQVSLEMQLGF